MVMNYDGAADAGAPKVPAPVVAAGTVIGNRFRIEALVGSGGLGSLYRSRDLKTQKAVAIRILTDEVSSDEATLERLREQVRIASTIQHKNLASIFGMGKEANLRYIAFEFIEGQSLRQLLDKKRRGGRTFSLKGAYNVLAHVCNALQQAHQFTAHGLPGPGSILINQTGRVKVCELGLVRALPPGSPALSRLSDAYCLAPEVITDPAQASPFGDIFSVGMVLYELLTGRIAEAEYAPASTLISGLPPDVDEVLDRCLHPEPAGRFADPAQLKAAFYAAVQGAREQAEVEGVMQGAARPAQAAVPAPAPAPAPAPRPAAAMPRAAMPPLAVPPPSAPLPAPPPVAAPLRPQMTGPSLPAPGPPRLGTPTPPQIGPITGPALPPPPSTPAAPPSGLSVEEHLAHAESVPGERWLVQKDRLDFGPFTLVDLMRQMLKGQFSGDDVVLDQETGQRDRIGRNPLLRDFAALSDRHVATEKMAKAEQAERQQDRRRRTVIILTVTITLAVLGAGGVLAAYFLYFRKPTTLEKIVYRDKKGDPELNIKGIDITWKNEPPDQAARRKKLGKRRKGAKGVAGDDVTHLGDATKEGGDALLSQADIQRVMQSNFRKLTRCVYEELRRTPGMRDVNIDFGIRGSGQVSSVTVNGQAHGPFASCVLAQMLRIKFPGFDGSLTRATFVMNLK